MKSRPKARSILHVDLDPFMVAVERSLDPSLRGRPVVIGPAGGLVAAASAEARSAGIRIGMPVIQTRDLCPEVVLRPGDLAGYARVGEHVVSILASVTRRVEQISADEAFLDLTPDGSLSGPPSIVAEALKVRIQDQLGLDASFGLAGSRLAARAASRLARPRGLLIILPGYESIFLGTQPLDLLDDVPVHISRLLVEAGVTSLGHLLAHDETSLGAIVGPQVAPRLLAAARGDVEDPVRVSAPPAWIQEEAKVRDRHSDATVVGALAADLVSQCCRRLRPHDLLAGSMTIEVESAATTRRRQRALVPSTSDEAALRRLAAEEAASIVRSEGTRRVAVRLTRLAPRDSQAPLFPEASGG